jgi:hypothetical protein
MEGVVNGNLELSCSKPYVSILILQFLGCRGRIFFYKNRGFKLASLEMEI